MRKKVLALAGGVVALIIAATTVTIILLKNNEKYDENALDPPNPRIPPPPSDSKLGKYTNAAVSCDAPGCADIGKSILEKKGTVADAAIATLLCMGVIHSQSMGIGGGFLAVYYNATSNSSVVLNARETAPALATENMFNGDPNLSQKGGLAVAIPGEFKGYWELYNRHGGGVAWKDIIAPTIDLCENGFEVDNHTAKALLEQTEHILRTPSMRAIFVNETTGNVYQLGDKIRRPQLAETLKIIANSPIGGDELYTKTSNLTQWLVEDLKELGGIITLDDMQNYKVDWPVPIKVPIHGGFHLHTVPPPGSGVLVAFILRILSEFQLTPKSLRADDDETSIRTYHLINEAFKHAYAKRTSLGDPRDRNVTDIVNDLVNKMTVSDDYIKSIRGLMSQNSTNNTYEYYGAEFYQPEDHGTAHMSIVGANGDSISVTSTVNLYFGAGIRSNRTGIIYNDEMDDFSAPNITNYFGVPPSPNNFIVPGKRPLSSMCPSIFTDDQNRVRLSLGTAGGTKITTATTYVALRNLWFNETIKEAIDSRRIHHQLYPMEISYEMDFLGQYVEGLERIGHKTARTAVGSSVTVGVSRTENGTLWANADFRKPHSIAGY